MNHLPEEIYETLYLSDPLTNRLLQLYELYDVTILLNKARTVVYPIGSLELNIYNTSYKIPVYTLGTLIKDKQKR